MHISVSDFPPGTTEEEVRQVLEAYGVPIRSVTLEGKPDGPHTLAVVDIDTDQTGARALAGRIDGHIWKGRRLRAYAHLFLR